MVCASIIEYEKDEQTYILPKYRCSSLTGKDNKKNQAVFLEGITLLTSVTPELVACFSETGPKGIPYSSYINYHEWRTARIRASYQWKTMQDIYEHIPGILNKLESGISVCDGGCSLGHQVILMAQNFPNSKFKAFDIDTDAIEHACVTAKDGNINNLKFNVNDACYLPKSWDNSFDLFQTWDVVHDVPKPDKMLNEIWRVLKPGGIFFMNDVNLHTNVANNTNISYSPIVYGMSLFHCMPVSLKEDGEGLGAAWGIEKQKQYLEAAGFIHIELLKIKHGVECFYVAYKPI